MLNAIFSQKLNTQSKTVNNAVITLGDTDDTGKGRKFKSRFIQPGIAGYPGQFGNVLIRKETLDKFINTLVGSPVIINHKNLTVKNADENRVGIVSNVWYDNKDGWYWCDGVIWDKTAQNLIANKGWSVSCSYDVTLADDAGGTENNIKYDMEFLNGVFTHLAIVNNPRYERANIVLNSKNVNADDIDYWFTTKTGTHIPVLKGQSKEEALKEFASKRGGGNKLNEQKQVGTHLQSAGVPKYINQEVTVYATPRHYEGGHTTPKINKILDYIYEGNNLQSTIDKFKTDDYPEDRITDIYNDFKNGVYTRIEGTPQHTKIKKMLNPEWRPQYDGTEETTDDILDDYERRTSTDTVGHGYSNYSMSKNAVSAYNKGSMPISKWTKKNIIDEINKLVEAYSISADVEKYSKMSIEDLKKNYLKEAGYHHTSKYYNTTYFYKIDLKKILQDTLKNQLAFDFTRKIQNSLEAIIDSYANGEIEKSKYDLKILKGLEKILCEYYCCNEVNNGWVTLDKTDEDGNIIRIFINGYESPHVVKWFEKDIEEYTKTNKMKVSLDGLDTKVSNTITKTINNALSEYKIKDIVSVSTGSLRNSYAFNLNNKDYNAIRVSKNLFSDFEDLKKHWTKDCDKLFHPEGLKDVDPVAGIITHELGHSITSAGGTTEFWDEIQGIIKEHNKELGCSTFRAFKKDKDKLNLKNFLSGYALYNQYEFVAEAFSDAKLSPNPCKYSKDVLKCIDKHFKLSSKETKQLRLFNAIMEILNMKDTVNNSKPETEETSEDDIWMEHYGLGYPTLEGFEEWEEEQEKQTKKNNK